MGPGFHKTPNTNWLELRDLSRGLTGFRWDLGSLCPQTTSLVTSVAASSIWMWDPTHSIRKYILCTIKTKYYHNQQKICFFATYNPDSWHRQLQSNSWKYIFFFWLLTFSADTPFLVLLAHSYREEKDAVSPEGHTLPVRAKDNVINISTIYWGFDESLGSVLSALRVLCHLFLKGNILGKYYYLYLKNTESEYQRK